MKIPAYFVMCKDLVRALTDLRIQTREVVTYILMDCALGMSNEICVLQGIEKEISLFNDTLGFDVKDGKFYEIISVPTEKNRSLKLLNNEEVELCIQDVLFMPRLDEIFQFSQNNNKIKEER